MKNNVFPVVTGAAVGTLAVFLNKTYQQGTLQVWLLQLKEQLLKAKQQSGYATYISMYPVNRNYISLTDELLPIDKTKQKYIHLGNISRNK